MKALYLAIKARLESLAPDVKFIHVFNNQFDLTENGQTYSFPFPCVFIEFQNDQPAQQLGNGIQIYQALIIRVHIGHNQYDAADGTMEQDLDVFDLKQQVYAALQKFEPAGAVMFIRTNETQDYNHTNIYHFIQEYTTSYVDQQQTEPVGGVIADPPFDLDLAVTYNPPPYLKPVSTPTLSATPSILEFGEVDVGQQSASQQITVSGFNLTNNVIVTAPTGFYINLDGGVQDDGPITLTPVSGILSSTVIYVRFVPIAAIAYSTQLTISSTGASVRTATLNGMGVSVESYDIDALAYFAQCTPEPSVPYKDAYNTLILALKASGDWAELDRLWIHASEFQQNARVSIVNPTAINLVEVNAPTWVQGRGYTGDGATNYLNSKFNLANSSIKYLQDSASLGGYFRNNMQGNGGDLGVVTDGGVGSGSFMNIRTGGNTFNYACNALQGTAGASVTDSRGLFSIRRTGSLSQAAYVNGVQVHISIPPSIVLANLEAFMLAFNQNGVPQGMAMRQISITFFGSGQVNQLTLYNALQAFATTIGFNV